MAPLSLRPRGDSLLRAWGSMIADAPRGTGYNLLDTKQSLFETRLEQFLDSPSQSLFETFWHPEVVDTATHLDGTILLSNFDNDLERFGTFLETLRDAERYNVHWEDELMWKHARNELYTRLTPESPMVLSKGTVDALLWLGISIDESSREMLASVSEFRTYYTDLLGHPTEGTDHEVPVRVELKQLCHAIESVDQTAIASELTGTNERFYRSLYGGGVGGSKQRGPVQLTDIDEIVRAYVWAKKNGAYERSTEGYWGGGYYETWKDQYATYFEETIKSRFDLTALEPDDIDPLFEALVDSDAANLDSPVLNHLMGGQFGNYAWNDVVDHFLDHPDDASRVLSMFFDEDGADVVTRLSAFDAHTSFLTTREENRRSGASIQRMATALLMFNRPGEHISIPASRMKNFLEDYSTLSEWESGFSPRLYRKIIGPLRSLRKDLATVADEYDVSKEMTMLDVHNIIWIYGKDRRSPTAKHLPPADE